METDRFKTGQSYDFGVTFLTEKEIIDFAKVFDPLDFHINKEAAEKSYFKGIIASGPHIFTLVHRTHWIPLFKETVICGLELTNWKFLKPVYPDMEVFSTATMIDTQPNHQKHVVAVRWKYEFKDQFGEMVQTLEMLILHKLQ